jgi:hypothetical protein
MTRPRRENRLKFRPISGDDDSSAAAHVSSNPFSNPGECHRWQSEVNHGGQTWGSALNMIGHVPMAHQEAHQHIEGEQHPGHWVGHKSMARGGMGSGSGGGKRSGALQREGERWRRTSSTSQVLEDKKKQEAMAPHQVAVGAALFVPIWLLAGYTFNLSLCTSCGTGELLFPLNSQSCSP